jgi:hypothetical protein
MLERQVRIFPFLAAYRYLTRPLFAVGRNMALSQNCRAFVILVSGLTTIRDCYRRAVDEIRDDRPFSTLRFRTDGKTIFLDITENNHDGRMTRATPRVGA